VAPATTRIIERLADPTGSISGYNGSFAEGMRPDEQASADCV
jgi:hypothetical protein